MASASRSIVIDAPAERVFDVISDYERYPEFLSEVKAIRTSDRRGNEVDIHYEIDVVKRIRYTLRMVEERPRTLRWTFVRGEVMRDNHGSWTLEPVAEARTRATYTVEIALGPLVPRPVVNALVDSSLPKMLESFKKRVESR
ncbi:MAG TPA: SRPBCC family protein [Myxococcaceae bacterium]|jgi:ribosome-associated toxin RatA of RatAB toxin-antitoxin module|nr:SRPBCC family protein [Myxococcaceae bacterium]